MSSRPKKSLSSKAIKARTLRERRRATMPAPIPLARIPAALRHEPRLERETMLLPHLCAERVCAEAMKEWGAREPLRWVAWLARRTRQLYATNRGFNRRLRSASGRNG